MTTPPPRRARPEEPGPEEPGPEEPGPQQSGPQQSGPQQSGPESGAASAGAPSGDWAAEYPRTPAAPAAPTSTDHALSDPGPGGTDGPARPGAEASGIWTDADDLDEDWPAPKPVRQRSPWLTVGIPVVVLALVITAIWAAGGFELRRNAVELKQPGQVITSGPFEFVFTEVTVQPAYDEEGWDVVVHGTGRVLGDKALRPRTGDNGPFVARDPRSREVQVPLTPTIGEPPTPEDRAQGTSFTPGLPMVPITLEMEFGEEYEPAGYLTWIVLEQEFSDVSLTQSGEETWNNSGHGSIMDLPVTVLPAD